MKKTLWLAISMMIVVLQSNAQTPVPCLTKGQVAKFTSILRSKKTIGYYQLVNDSKFTINFFNKTQWIYKFEDGNSGGYDNPELTIFEKTQGEMYSSDTCKMSIGKDGIYSYFRLTEGDNILSVIISVDTNGQFQLIKRSIGGCALDFCQWDECWTPRLGGYHTKGFNIHSPVKTRTSPSKEEIKIMKMFKNVILINIGETPFILSDPIENKAWSKAFNFPKDKMIKGGWTRNLSTFNYSFSRFEENWDCIYIYFNLENGGINVTEKRFVKATKKSSIVIQINNQEMMSLSEPVIILGERRKEIITSFINY